MGDRGKKLVIVSINGGGRRQRRLLESLAVTSDGGVDVSGLGWVAAGGRRPVEAVVAAASGP